MERGADVNVKENRSMTPLHWAARSGHLSVVKLLVERGADVRVKNDHGQTASDLARSKGKIYVAEWLGSLAVGSER